MMNETNNSPEKRDTKTMTETTTTTVYTTPKISFQLPSRLFQPSSSSSSTIKKTILLKCIDCHAGGEPARVVLAGVEIPSSLDHYSTALQKRTYFMDHADYYRKILLLEPRGYPCQNANFIFPPPPVSSPMTTTTSDDSTTNSTSSLTTTTTSRGNYYQYVIAEQNKIYPLMSGHNTICVATALLETGVIPMIEPISQFTLESPAGLIPITAYCNQGKAEKIVLQNAPSFVEQLDITVQVPGGIGPVTCDIAYGGMWYAVVNVSQFGTRRAVQTDNNNNDNDSNNTSSPSSLHQKLQLHPDNGAELCRIGEMIKVACREQFPVQHPTIDYPGVDILVFREPPTRRRPKRKQQENDDDGNDQPTTALYGRNTVVMSNTVLDWDKPETWTAMLDRSPCGTGTCAVMAVLHARGELAVGEPFVHESIVGSTFVGTILQETTIEEEEVKGQDDDDEHRPVTKMKKTGIIPQIEGSAYITQYSEVVVDPDDPFPQGYRVGDIW